MRHYLIAVFAAVAITLVACDFGPKSASGFRLPDGDIERGNAAFLELKCTACHTVSGMELPPPPSAPAVNLVLGGQVTSVRTYGQLVRSIINPSHKLAPGYPKELISVDGKSKMTNFNDAMTVHQMIDLVAFLQSRYNVVLPQPTHY